MVAHVLRLRLALLAGALRGDRRQTLRMVVATLFVVLGTILAILAVMSLRDSSVGTASTVIVLGGALFVFGFFLGPVITDTTDQLDPRRFAVFGVDERRLPGVLVVAALVSVPSLALVAVVAAAATVGASYGAPVVLTVAAAIVAVLTGVLLARVAMALNALFLPERRSRELTSLFALTLIVVAVPVGVFIASMRWNGDVPSPLRAAASFLGFSPFGAAFALPFAVAEGRLSDAWASGVVALLTLVGVAGLWAFLVRRALTTTVRPTSVRERPGLGWFALMPANAFGAIAARSLVYWLRDRRYLVNMIIVPFAALISVVPLLVAGVPMTHAAALPIAVVALFFGWMPHNDVAYDSTAFWTHVASGVSGVADRLGRLVPILLIALPVLAVGITLTLTTIGRWSLVSVFIGVTISLFFSGLGLSSVASVLAPYAVTRPGDSPFQQPQRSSSRGAFGQAGTLLGAIVLSLPTLWLGWRALVDVDASLVAPLWTGIATGVGVLLVGVAVGASAYDRRGEQLMEFIETT